MKTYPFSGTAFLLHGLVLEVFQGRLDERSEEIRNDGHYGEKQCKCSIMRFPQGKEKREARKKLIVGGKWSDPVTKPCPIAPAVILLFSFNFLKYIFTYFREKGEGEKTETLMMRESLFGCLLHTQPLPKYISFCLEDHVA